MTRSSNTGPVLDPLRRQAAIQKELERRVAAKNRWTIIGIRVWQRRGGSNRYKLAIIEKSDVDRVIVWCIYEVKGDKIRLSPWWVSDGPANCALYRWVQSQPPAR